MISAPREKSIVLVLVIVIFTNENPNKHMRVLEHGPIRGNCFSESAEISVTLTTYSLIVRTPQRFTS